MRIMKALLEEEIRERGNRSSLSMNLEESNSVMDTCDVDEEEEERRRKEKEESDQN